MREEELINKACALYEHDLRQMQRLCELLQEGSSDIINVEESVKEFRMKLVL